MSQAPDDSLIVKMLYMMGPSGSGKTTLSQQLATTYEQILGSGTVTSVSLDPANYLSQGKHIQINDLVNIEDVMQQYQIGPNASIFYAMDFVLANIEWLQGKILNRLQQVTQKYESNGTKYPYHLIIFDLPGQIELYINSNIVKDIIGKISDKLKSKYTVQSCVVELFDCSYMHDINQFLSLCMMSLATMINLELPHVNVINKVDILKHAQAKPNRGLINELFSVPSAAELVEQLKPYSEEGKQTNSDHIAKILDTYGQVSFMPCSLFKPQLVINLIHEMEKVFGTLEISSHHPFYQQATSSCDMFSHERALTELENQLGEDEEEDLQRMMEDMSKEAKKR